LLETHRFLPLDGKHILEIGCGYGNVLASLLDWGAKPQDSYGVDLLPERIELARKTYPDFHFQCLNAEKLGFPSGTFDLVLFFTVYSSILDGNMRERMALEAGRVLKRGGAILWYDFRYDNPANPHVRGVTESDVRHLFPEYTVFLRSVSLLPPLARTLGKFTASTYPLLSRIGFLRTHYLGILMKP
jgi:SAM-dependent methyltransferase